MPLIRPQRVPIEARISPILHSGKTIVQRIARYFRMVPEKHQVTHALALQIAVYVHHFGTNDDGSIGEPFTAIPPQERFLTGNNNWVIDLNTGKTPLDELGLPFGRRQHETPAAFEARADADPRPLMLHGDALDEILFGRDTSTPLDERLATAILEGDTPEWNSYGTYDAVPQLTA